MVMFHNKDITYISQDKVTQAQRFYKRNQDETQKAIRYTVAGYRIFVTHYRVFVTH
jgi:hypothetical protein